MTSSQANPVLLDNTVLSNFARIDRYKLVMDLWPSCATTFEAWQEFQVGVIIGKLPKNVWKGLTLIELTADEHEISNGLSNFLGLGERACIAAAKHRNGLFVTDDRKARQVALELGIKITGTLGILVVAVERQKIALEEANQLLAAMIENGYRSPVDELDSLLLG
jgi:predicted nucleic acid-binding protein